MIRQKGEKNLTVSIHQPNFMPWLGFFDKIARSDIFILFDDVQLVRGKSFTTRTKILVQGTENWLTVPVTHKSDNQLIKDINVDIQQNWKKKHLRTIYLNYKNSLHFEEIYEHIKQVYDLDSDLLIDYNIKFIKDTCNLLGLKRNFISSSDIPSLDKTGLERIIELIQSVEGTKYISGTGAGSRRYIDKEIFNKNLIELIWQPDLEFTYTQNKTTQFIKNLSIIDVLFNAKEKLMEYMYNFHSQNL